MIGNGPRISCGVGTNIDVAADLGGCVQPAANIIAAPNIAVPPIKPLLVLAMDFSFCLFRVNA
jgi:hypothetical protein